MLEKTLQLLNRNGESQYYNPWWFVLYLLICHFAGMGPMFCGRTCLSKWMQRPRALSGIVWSKSVLPAMGPCQACSKQAELQSFSLQFQKDALFKDDSANTFFRRIIVQVILLQLDICVENHCKQCHKSGQIIATSHDLTPNGGLVREIPLFQGNLGWQNITIWPDKSIHPGPKSWKSVPWLCS